MFIFLFPGMIAYALVEQGQLALPGGADTAFPVLVRELLPAGIKGVVLGGAIAALMSSLASLFNSAATLFTVDFYERLRPGRSKGHYLQVGRIATVAVVVLGMAWVPVLTSGVFGDSLYQVLQNLQSLIAPAIVAVFFYGLFSTKATPAAGFYGLTLGFALGMSKLALDFTPDVVSTWPLIGWLRDMNPWYFSCLLLAVTVAIMFVVSRFTPSRTAEELSGLTYRSITPEQRAEVRASWNGWDLFHTFVILGVVGLVYAAFW